MWQGESTVSVLWGENNHETLLKHSSNGKNTSEVESTELWNAVSSEDSTWTSKDLTSMWIFNNTNTLTSDANVTDDVMSNTSSNVTAAQPLSQAGTGAILLRFGIAVLIMTVNTLTIVTFCRVRALRTLSNMLTVSLAVTDLMVGVVVLVSAFNLIPALTPLMSSTADACLARLGWFFVCCCVSMVTVCLTACERYLFIVHPYKHINFVNAKVLGSLIALSWLAGLVYGLTPLHRYRWNINVSCDMYFMMGPDHVVYSSAGIFLAACIPTLIFYSLIGRLVLEKRRSIVVPQPRFSEQSNASSSSELGQDCRHAPLRSKLIALKAPVVVFGVFFVSWAPHMVAYVLHDAGFTLSRNTRVWITNLGLANSAMNFFVYLSLNRQFRKALSSRVHRSLWGRRTTSSRFFRAGPAGVSSACSDREPTMESTVAETPYIIGVSCSPLSNALNAGRKVYHDDSVPANTLTEDTINNPYAKPTSTSYPTEQVPSVDHSTEHTSNTAVGIPSFVHDAGHINYACNTGQFADAIPMISSSIPCEGNRGVAKHDGTAPMTTTGEIGKKQIRIGWAEVRSYVINSAISEWEIRQNRADTSAVILSNI